MNRLDALHYFGFPGGRPVWPWADWRERAAAPAAVKPVAAKQAKARKRLPRGYALTAQGYAVALGPRPVKAGSKLAKSRAVGRVKAHRGGK
ncbi:MAG: hypothetical protein LBI48_02100 [Burkholderiaceae bacterium]|jgi:hypothetical protein|nr:hypothetical protein [Burkholderiaceae bacterium]